VLRTDAVAKVGRPYLGGFGEGNRKGRCRLPFANGQLEEFGPSAPLGTNVYLVRTIAAEAAKQEYFVMFPD